MAGLTADTIWRSAAATLVALALWNSWWSRGLFLDGYALLAEMIRFGTWNTFYGPRENLMALTQTPAAIAIRAGVTDTQMLARLLSLGLFAVPAAYYCAALRRAHREPVLLAAVLCAVGLVYLPTSFFIIGEHNGVCAMAVFTAVMLVTTTRISWGEGAVLALTAFITFRSHEATLVIGPVLALMVAWRVAALQWRTPAAGLYVLAALLFAGSGAVAAASLFTFHDKDQMNSAFGNSLVFWRNIQFIMPFVAVLAIVTVGLARPRLLERRGLFLGAGALLAIAALSPLLWLLPGDVKPFPKTHYETRQAAFGVASAIAAFIFAYGAGPRLAVLQVLRRQTIARRLLLFTVALAMAAVPADIVLTELWRRSIGAFHATISARSFLIPVEETAFIRAPYKHFIEDWTLPMQSLVLRTKPGDGVIMAPRDFKGWQSFEPLAELPDLHPYYWGR